MIEPVGPESRIVRSGVSTLFLWMGIALVVVGVLVGVGGAIAGLVTGDPSMLMMLILTAIFGTAGVLMHLAGRRSAVRLDPDGLIWRGVFGRSRSVPWSQVFRVEVPQHPREGRTVALLLHNGVRLPVNAIRMSSNERGSWADNGYLTAGNEIVAAHQAWLSRTLR